MTAPTPVNIHVYPTKGDIAAPLVQKVLESYQNRPNPDKFAIGLSGGSLPALLQGLKEIDVDWSIWHVLLADERCVASTHADSNLGALQAAFLSHVPIPANQVYGINEDLLKDTDESTHKIAQDYQKRIQPLLRDSMDLMLLGFGPDGHTCSLFPSHALLQESQLWVAGINDSPKSPPRRITLTYPALAQTDRILVVGAGSSKQAVMDQVFGKLPTDQETIEASIQDSTLPIAKVQPRQSLEWMVDGAAVRGA